MKELFKKYIADSLNRQELEKIRQQDNSLTDIELEEFIHEGWMNEEVDTSEVPDALMRRVRSNLYKLRKERQPLLRPYIKILAWASMLLLPIFILSTFYFYHRESPLAASDELTISTGVGERANITLPDGTRVALSDESQLKYIPKIFNKKQRFIKFSGEAYFKVAKDHQRPFIIDAKGLNVRVLGTVFDLKIRPNEETAELGLESGRVLFSSLLSGKAVIINPGQKAILHQSTGEISVIQTNIQDMSSWQRNELVFRNATLDTIIKSLEKAYGVHIINEVKLPSTDLFTGTLTTSDLNGVLEVLERSYHFTVIMSGKNIMIKR
jgi:transmembrane sensor